MRRAWKRNKSKKRQFCELMGIALVLMAIAAFLSVDSDDGRLTVSFIDVGQGDAVFVKTPEGRAILIDGGEQSEFSDSIHPFLTSKGVNNISVAVASHCHSDHVGGIYELFDVMPVKLFVLPRVKDDGWLKGKLLERAEQRRIDVKEVGFGDSILADDDIELKVLFPNEKLFSNTGRNRNNDSIVLRMSYFDTSFLFTGDLESEAEAVLLNSGVLEADVLKVGHHGSSTSTSAEFLKEVNPDYAVISAGTDNSYGHPHKEVLERLENESVKIYRTDLSGDIEFLVDSEGIRSIKTENDD